jgi:hypothetical protein
LGVPGSFPLSFSALALFHRPARLLQGVRTSAEGLGTGSFVAALRILHAEALLCTLFFSIPIGEGGGEDGDAVERSVATSLHDESGAGPQKK